MAHVRVAAKAMIMRDGALLTIEHQEQGQIWYTLPGGGQHHGEALTDALRRECREEIACEVVVGPLRFVRDYIGANHEFAALHPKVHKLDLVFDCTLAPGGEPSLGEEPDGTQVGIAWLPLSDMARMNLYPKFLREALGAGTPAGGYLGDVN
jgi:ADP-ribose pyrophosphatase YjhB (NUDIX family)